MIAKTADLHESTLAEAVRWYAENTVPAGFRPLDPLLIRYVVRNRIDWRRCTTDGTSITVHNGVMWTPTREEDR